MIALLETKLHTLCGEVQYEFLETRLDTCESFWIRGQLDQSRVNRVTHQSLTLYVPLPDEKVGIASARIPASATDEELDVFLRDLLQAARLAANPTFAYEAGCKNHPEDLSDRPSLQEHMRHLAQAFTSAKLPEGTRLNSYELFVYHERTHRLHSAGTDVWDERTWTECEWIVDARRGDEIVELYDARRGCDWTSEEIHGWLQHTAQQTLDRLEAKKNPIQGSATVLLPSCHARLLYSWFIDQTGASAQYQDLCTYHKGDVLQSETDPADRLTIRGVKYLPGSSENLRYDAEGREISDRLLWEGGKLVAYTGSSRFCSYMKEEKSYLPRQFRVSGGTQSREALFATPCLEVQQFSDFSVEDTTGDYAGEIRLAYWWDETGARRILTGGSVSGNIKDALPTWKMDHAVQVEGTMELPCWTRVENASIVAADSED